MSSAIDPLTGLVDVDLIQTGSSSRHRDIEEQKRNQLRRIINSIDKPTIRYMELYNAFREDREDVYSI